MFYLRICKSLKRKRLYFIYSFFRIILRHYSFKFGFDIPVATKIGYGFYIGHFGGVVIHSQTVIGNNCNVSQNITIGYSASPGKMGCPVIGNNVFIGPGAVLLGHITVGDNVAIGANTVVTSSVLPNRVIVGAPTKIISEQGSTHYILNKYSALAKIRSTLPNTSILSILRLFPQILAP